ncbi:MAG TPA: hypothetical protein DER09_14975 [Prolixibacteraceae bacterium]|nr:hypothetical protein [Prolixibacteraceae bacterium]
MKVTCNQNFRFFLKTLIFNLFIILHFQIGAQPLRYSEKVFEKSDTIKDVEYAKAPWLNNPVALLSEYNIHEGEAKTEMRPLYMDIFSPSGDTVQHRPAIIFMHSGGFLLGTRHNEDMLALCDSFARRGYVTATIDYRIGMGATINRFFGIIIGAQVDKSNGYRSFYRAMQDSRASIRFLKQNAENYGIDTTKIFFYGSSAGAILSIQNLYLDKTSEIDSAAFESPSLGNPDTIGVSGFGAKANAVVALWGSLQKPELIENETTPVFLAHGTADDVVPFKKGKLLGNIEIPISTIKLELPDGYGSFCIDTALQNREIPHQTYFVEEKKHEFYGVDTGEFPEDGPNTYWDTIIWKTSDFLFDIFQPEADFQVDNQNLTSIFTNTSSEIYSAQWDFGDNTTGTGNIAEHIYAKSGIYKITLTACNKNMACDTISKMVETGNQVFVNEFPFAEIRIFPNPANDFVVVEGLIDNVQIRIFNMNGKLIETRKNYENGPLNIQQLETGVYLLEIKNRQQKAILKLVKTR